MSALLSPSAAMPTSWWPALQDIFEELFQLVQLKLPPAMDAAQKDERSYTQRQMLFITLHFLAHRATCRELASVCLPARSPPSPGASCAVLCPH